ncbi:DUF4089 domain-containing protein [Roseiarcaceae bacterium H3SJ34-1]|uniref:DUF4089 domain-containing protein n=1 Tax=Terripilifer ovatus TaxID=3032367 RepID=UPI003AB9277E|nr:DUF4089 domain-containing protein [Roseiarcaceae bacterium H3SJ34-1]
MNNKLDDKFDIDAFISSSCALLDIRLTEESKSIVRMNLEVAAKMAATVGAFPMDEREEPAPVFKP